MGLLDIFSRKTSLIKSGVLRGCIDSHSHILFGVDDGIKTLEESLQALALEEEMGIKETWCTPHIMEDVPNATSFLKARFGDLESAYDGNIRLHLAAEYMMDTLFDVRLEEKDLLVMDDDCLLIETSSLNPPLDYRDKLRQVQSMGYRPILAHPERYRYMSDDDYDTLYRMGVKMQLNLPSLLGYYGKTAMQKASMLLSKGYYTHVGTDCHRPKALMEPYNKELLSKDDAKALLKKFR